MIQHFLYIHIAVICGIIKKRSSVCLFAAHIYYIYDSRLTDRRKDDFKDGRKYTGKREKYL